MNVREAVIERRCWSCGLMASCRAYESVVQSRLQWGILYQCASCDETAEECGWDQTPAEVRQALLDQCGVYRLQVAQGTTRMPMLRVFRARGVPVREVSTLVESIINAGQPGTEAELELLRLHLAAAGVRATVTQDAPPPP
ncbi:hypothetical protein ACTMTJ_20020 [Phytohabitans sp. LJ34]|uniref:hypothetical protein n=1 Tax=Phytohabitans sp. LJ34 TaxID=3452217 RepID=UPI003F8A5BE1